MNKAWAPNIIGLRAKAARAGFILTGYSMVGQRAPDGARITFDDSSYRTPAQQAWLYKHKMPAAPPGKSMHQWGLAIDFQCNGDSISRRPACLKWMNTRYSSRRGVSNAKAFGVYMLRSEIWHWSSNGR